jgi:hypothetical protein
MVEASGWAAMPALARLSMNDDAAAAGAARRAVAAVWGSHEGPEPHHTLVGSYVEVDGAVEGLIQAVMQQAAPTDALGVLSYVLDFCEPEVCFQGADTAGLCARLVSFVAAVGNDPWQPGDDRFLLCLLALKCMRSLTCCQSEAVELALISAEGFWPALEGVLARGGNGQDEEADAIESTLRLVSCLTANDAAAHIAAGRDSLLAGLAAALTRPWFRGFAEEALDLIVTRGDGMAAVAAAVAGALATATDEATRQPLREWLGAPPMEMEAAAISVLERQAREAAALRARVAELEAIPVNTRAAIVELAHAVRSKRPREEEGEAAVEEPQQQQRQRCD